MKNTVVVKVTPRDILFGRRGDGGHCAVALAVARTTKKHANVGSVTATIDGDIYNLPAAATTFIDRFDNRRLTWAERLSSRTFELVEA